MNIRKLVAVIVSVILIVSLILNFHFYVNLSRETENNLNNMRARALATLGSELAQIAYFLDRFVNTMNYSILHEEVRWGIGRAEWEAEICTQGLSEKSEPVYYELTETAQVMDSYFSPFQAFNATKLLQITQLLYQIGNSFIGLDMVKDEDPLKYLYNSDVETVIRNCQQLQDIIQH